MKRRVTRQELVAFLLALRGATFATFCFDTDARAKKTGNPFGVIRKRTTVNGQLNFHYDAAVVRRLAKEGKGEDEFRRGESWHEPVLRDDGSLTPLAKKKKGDGEAAYIRFRFLSQVAPAEYFDEQGNLLDTEKVKPFLPTPSAYANQGTDDPVIFLTYGLEGVQELRTAGDTLLVAHE